MVRIAVGGIHIECSTYNPLCNSETDFTVLRGAQLLAAPYFAFLKDYPATFASIVHAKAIAGGPVVRAFYEAIKAEFLAGLEQTCPLDGIYLAMHGAMFVEGMEDAEGDFIAAVRQRVGPEVLIAVSYDLHGNVTQPIVDAIDIFSTYRTAPHIDVEDTMRRCVSMLVRAIGRKEKPFIVWCPVPVVLPGEQTSTHYEPAKGLYGSLPALEQTTGAWDVSLMVGYVWADEPRASAAAVLTGTDLAALSVGAERLAQAYWGARAAFDFGTWTGSIGACIDRAAAHAGRPFIIADSGDNPTGGGVGDRPDVLRELILRRCRGVIVAGLADGPATDLAYAAGLNGRLETPVGATLDPQGGPAVMITARVEHLAAADQPSERIAVVEMDGLTLVLTAKRRPFHRLTDFTSLGLKPQEAAMVVVKSGYLSPDMQALAQGDAMALSPGVVDQNVERLVRRRAAHRTYPFDQNFAWLPSARPSRRAAAQQEAGS